MKDASPAYAGPIPGPLSARLTEKVAIVTGGGADDVTGVHGNGAIQTEVPGMVGSGVAISRLFAADGCRVVVATRSPETAERTVALIKQSGGEAISVEADVSSVKDCERIVSTALASYGRLDILVNNAGQGPNDADWDYIVAVDLKGAALMAEAAIPHLPTGGAIVNISSISALLPLRRSEGTFGWNMSTFAYVSSKGGLLSLTRAMAERWGSRGVRANCIIPGLFWSPMTVRDVKKMYGDTHDLERHREQRRSVTALETEGNGWDIAHAAAFLASDQARWITGVSLPVDGGLAIQERTYGSPSASADKRG